MKDKKTKEEGYVLMWPHSQGSGKLVMQKMRGRNKAVTPSIRMMRRKMRRWSPSVRSKTAQEAMRE